MVDMSTIMRVELDADHVHEIARQALTRPGSYAAWDDRWYTTHGCVMSWADRSDDILTESNYLTALSELQGAVAHDPTGASEERGDDVEDTTASHWLVGSLRELFVRVYVDPNRDWEPGGAPDLSLYTPAFLRAVELLDSLADYPILDESDYSERETEAWFRTFDLALSDAQCDLSDLDDAIDVQLITERGAADRWCEMPELGHPDDLSWDEVATGWRVYRDAYYDWQAQRFLPCDWPATGAPINQPALDVTVR